MPIRSTSSVTSTQPTVHASIADDDERDAFIASLEQHGVRVVDVDSIEDATSGNDVDCLVVDDLERLIDDDVDQPVIALHEPGTDPPTGDGVEPIEGTPATISYGRLADRIRSLAAAYRSSTAHRSERDVVSRLENRIAETERKITALHGVAMQFASANTTDEVYEFTVDAAERILDLDICFAFAVAGDRFVPKASSSTPTDRELEPVPLDRGAMGTTHRTGESTRAVDIDLHEVGEAEFGSYRSGISVPIGDDGVFQAVSEQTAAFDEIDLELAELLTTHAAAAVTRLGYEAALQVERDQYAALFENSQDCIVECRFVDGESIIEHVNPAFERTFGFEATEVVGESIDDVVAPPELRDEATALTAEVERGDVVKAEVRRQTATGLTDFLVRSVPLDDDRMYAVYTDITERKQIERSLDAENERLGAFASGAAHDLRNPLSIAFGHLDLAASGGDGEHLDSVRDALVRMDERIDEMLTSAREGNHSLAMAPVEISGLLERCWETVASADATIVLDGAFSVVANENRLTQIFENLLRNSVEQYDGDGDVTVHVGALDDGFYVEDDGPGIPVGRRAAVFERGVSGRPDGTGIGLSIVAEYVDAHDWSIDVTEGTAGGARFEITGVDGAREE